MSFRRVAGREACKEALQERSPEELKKIYLKSGWQKSPSLVYLAELARLKGLSPLPLPKRGDFAGDFFQGVCVLVSSQPKFKMPAVDKPSVLCVLDRVQDPRNLAAIARTAWLMKADGLFSSFRHSAKYSAFVSKAGAGALEHIPLESKSNLIEWAKELKKNQFWTYALDPSAKKSLWEEKLHKRSAFFLGGEAQGLRKSLQKTCDLSLSIPQVSPSVSYNVSVSAAIALAEYRRQSGFA